MNTESNNEPTLSSIRAARLNAAEKAAEERRLAAKRERLAALAEFDAVLTAGLARMEEYKKAKEKLDGIAGDVSLTTEQLDELLVSTAKVIHGDFARGGYVNEVPKGAHIYARAC